MHNAVYLGLMYRLSERSFTDGNQQRASATSEGNRSHERLRYHWGTESMLQKEPLLQRQ